MLDKSQVPGASLTVASTIEPPTQGELDAISSALSIRVDAHMTMVLPFIPTIRKG